MKRAAFGVQMHSGWGVLVAIAGDPNAFEVAARRRIVIADPEMPGAIQPYHFAAQVEAAQQKKHLAACEASSSRLAAAAIRGVLTEMAQRQYQIEGAAVLFAAGRPLPVLEKILAAHPLIHTAEGQFFRQTISRAFTDLDIPVDAIRERELDDRAKTAFGKAVSRVQANISNIGRSQGPPWTRDHKAAALAAALILCR